MSNLNMSKLYGYIVLSTELSANAQNVSFVTLYGGQFTLSTQLIILKYSVILFHWRSTTVSLENYPFYSNYMVVNDSWW